MKKFVAMLFLSAFVFSAAIGCSGDDKDKAKKDAKPAATDTKKTDK